MRDGVELGVAQPNKAFPCPIGIFWDMENCPIPVDVNADDVAGNIRMAIRIHPAVEGRVAIFSAYGDFNQFPRRLREGCQRTGINLIDVPNGRKDASDKAILVDMFLFALDNPPPGTILLITGDVDFAPALHKLGQRGYRVLLALPAGQTVASALCSAGQYVWDWPSVARGEGFVPSRVLRSHARERNRPNHMNMSGILGHQSSDDSDTFMEDEPCMQGRYAVGIKEVDRGSGDNLHLKHVPVALLHTQSLNQPFQHASCIPTHIHPPTKHTQIMDTGTADDTFNEFWAHPGDMEGLKNQLINLLKLNGGMLSFDQVSGEYKKMYGRPLFLSEYGSLKLVDLLRRMGDSFVIESIGGKKKLFLQECTPALQTKYESKSICNTVVGQLGGNFGYLKEGDTDLVKEVILLHAKDQRKPVIDKAANEREISLPCGFAKNNITLNTSTAEQFLKLETFKCELQELLVTHACRILLTNFWKVYHRRYSRELDLNSFGAADLDDLFKKVQDVAIVVHERGTGRKFLVVSNSTSVQHTVGGEEARLA